jgi:DNA-directed RNA polymerase specialized sigma24 family protein
MTGEVLSRWERFVTHPVFKRYGKYAKEPRALFESIGEDLASSNEEIREIAFWALVYAMPELTSILYEWETRQPGWRDRKGKDQQMINRGTDIVSDLHCKLVEQHLFKIGGEYGKDPRPFVNKEIKHKKIDEWRKRSREVLLDHEDTLKIPGSAASLEDTVLESIQYEERKRELRDWGFFRSDDELDLFVTVHVDASPLTEIRKHFGICSKPALRQRISRANKKIVAARDKIFTYLLITWHEFSQQGKLPRFTPHPERCEEWTKRAKQCIQPGAWLNEMAADGENALAARPLTRSFSHAPGYIYLAAVRKDYMRPLPINLGILAPGMYVVQRASGGFSLLKDLTALPLVDISELIDSTSRKPQRASYTYCLLKAYSTELPGLNEALADVPDDYNVWLISYSELLVWWYGQLILR